MEDSHRSKKRRTETWSPDDPGPKSHHDSKKPRNNRSDSYRPAYSHKDPSARPSHRRDARDSYRPQNGSNRDSRHESSRSNRSRSQPQTFQPNNHSTKSRKNNPSTRIRSLQKQLSHASAATLPANVLADRKRELQFLLDSRDGAGKSSRDQREKKLLQQYHMVRFFERRRAERNLKRARKQIDSAEADEDTNDKKEEKSLSEALKKEVLRSACDLLYSIYAPLGEKYIALFAGGGQTEKSKFLDSETKAGRKQDNRQQHNKLPKDNQHVVRITTQGQSQDDIFRPPHWYTIQSIIQDSAKDTEDVQDDMMQVPKDNDAWTSVSVTPVQLQRLETLRDGKDAADPADANQNEAGLALRSKEPAAAASGKKRKAPSWQDETNEPVDPADADTDTDGDMDSDGGMALQGRGENDGSEKDIESDSYGDGGFFER